jgi:EmrB/QacA subfamily drug resistance transporter
VQAKPHPHGPVRQHYNVTLAVLTLAGIAFAMQQTMVVPALPALQQELHTSTTWITWLLTGFLLTASVATPIFGKLGDQYGKERLLLISLSIFFVGCVGAVFAWSLPALIACRFIQGCGAAVFPLSFAIIKDEFPPEKVGMAVGVVSSVFGVGGGLGLSFSGVIVDQLSWRYLFVIGAVPVGIAALLVYRFVPESPIKTPTRLDIPGALLLSSTLVCLLLGLTEGEHWGWTSGRIVGLFLAAAALAALGAIVESRVAEPMVDLRMLTGRTVLLTNIVTLVGTFAVFSTWVLIPNFVEAPAGVGNDVTRLVHYGFHASSTQAGLYLMPGAVAGLLTGPLGARFGQRYGWKWSAALGMVICASGLVVLALWHDRPWQVVVGSLLLGGGFPMIFAAVANIVVNAVRPTETGVATGVNTVMRTIGGVIGGQTGAALLSSQTIAGTSVPTETAFTTTFSISAGAALIAAFLALLIMPGRRSRRLQLAEATE